MAGYLYPGFNSTPTLNGIKEKKKLGTRLAETTKWWVDTEPQGLSRLR